MTEAEADAVFARYDEIGRAKAGTRLVVRVPIYGRFPPKTKLPVGAQLRVLGSTGTSVRCIYAGDDAVREVGIEGYDFHKLEIVDAAEQPQADVEEPAHHNLLMDISASTTSMGWYVVDPRLRARLVRQALKAITADDLRPVERSPFSQMQTVAEDPMLP